METSPSLGRWCCQDMTLTPVQWSCMKFYASMDLQGHVRSTATERWQLNNLLHGLVVQSSQWLGWAPTLTMMIRGHCAFTTMTEHCTLASCECKPCEEIEHTRLWPYGLRLLFQPKIACGREGHRLRILHIPILRQAPDLVPDPVPGLVPGLDRSQGLDLIRPLGLGDLLHYLQPHLSHRRLEGEI